MKPAPPPNLTALYRSGKRISLGDALGSGREGSVHRLTDDPAAAAKILLPSHPDPAGAGAKLSLMVEHAPRRTAARNFLIAWPNAVITSPKKRPRPVGYTMPLLDPGAYRHIGNYFNPSRRRQLLTRRTRPYTYLHLLLMARNLALALDELHRHHTVAGDMNSRNVLASDRCRIALIDADSFQVRDPADGSLHRCPVGTPEYTPPRLQFKDFADLDRSPQDDLFSLAVMIYQLLLQGAHPYAGIPTPPGRQQPGNLATRIAEGLYLHSTANTETQPTPLTAAIWKDLPLKRHFNTAFLRPNSRTTPRDWASALDRAIPRLRRCRRVSSHLHFSRNCTWCRYSALSQLSPFPLPEEAILTSKPPSRSTAR